MAMEKYDIVNRLGFGSHGAVYLVKHYTTKKFYALKKIELDERKKSRTREGVLKEASILSQLKHPHIVLFHECFLDPTREYVCLILDYCDGGSLADKIQTASQNNSFFTEKQIMQWFIQIVMAVQYIHSKHILHRDLKTENVFLNKRSVIKLGDFGISKILDNTIDVAKTVVGTPSYLSPELCQDIPYNSKSDIWAVGCLLYEICALDRPFDGQSLIRLFFNIVKAEYKPLPAEAPAGIQDLVACMLVKEPESRPSASAILNLPYVKQHLASFISDTESFRIGRTRREEGAGEANDSLSPSKNRLPMPLSVPGRKSPGLHRSLPAGNREGFSESYAVDSSKSHSKNVNNSSNRHSDDQEKELGQAEEDEQGEDYSDDFDSSASEIEEDLPLDSKPTEAKSEDEAFHINALRSHPEPGPSS
ncbi:serine/threonine-protein kinase Nek4-like [Elysia marginata]|uniref:non-specific serine/threonine protein kinase n=1 Tax=Elysia marginata TaxID=1093978 RepID=A0AAV4FTM0_9GAST|nr:serine/threonine-protein kinase Nek4-like [Elysia marginata]